MTPLNAAKIADLIFLYSKKDQWLTAASSRWTSIQTADLVALIRASYENQLNLTTTILGRVNDLTVAHAVILAEEFRYSSKDSFLLKAVELTTDLSAANLDDLAAAGYQMQEAIKAKGRTRLAR